MGREYLGAPGVKNLYLPLELIFNQHIKAYYGIKRMLVDIMIAG